MYIHRKKVHSDMFVSRIKRFYRVVRSSRFQQGDLLRSIEILYQIPGIKYKYENNFEFIFVLSQDCDLEQDYNSRKKPKVNPDKYLQTILICPAYRYEQIVMGQHIEDMSMSIIDKKKVQNNDELKRYHFIQSDKSLGIPDLVVDFKHVHTFPRDMLYKIKRKKYIASLEELFREHLSQRFSFYLSRIGLPLEMKVTS